MPHKIALALIVKDETKDLERCLESVAGHVDAIYLAITTDNAHKRAKIKALAAKYRVFTFPFEWIDNFSAARNFIFLKVPKTFDWIMWLDADDVVHHPEQIRKVLEKTVAKTTSVIAPYVVDRTVDGKPVSTHKHTRIVRNDGTWEWRGIIHEVLTFTGRLSIVAETALFEVEQLPKQEMAFIDPAKRLALIKREYERAKTPRAQYYLARELRDMGHTLEAITHYRQYLARPDAWDEEQYLASRQLAEIFERQARYEAALDQCWQTLKINPYAPEGYFDIARQYYFLSKNWDRVVFWIDRGRMLAPYPWRMTNNPLDVTLNWIIYYAIAQFHLGDYKKCIEFSKMALAIDPAAPYHAENIKRASDRMKA